VVVYSECTVLLSAKWKERESDREFKIERGERIEEGGERERRQRSET
jgi:hypothetical protein